MPDLVSPPGLALRMFFFRRAYRLSTKLFTVSEFSKSRIEHFLGSAKPLVVTYSAVLPGLSGFPRGSGKSGEKTKKTKTILFIGNIKKHKGLWCLLDAFLRAKAAGLEEKLVIVGSKDKFRSADRGVMKKLDAADSSLVEFTGFISGEELRRRLAEAALLVQPSLYEGFGLPPLEAMLCGTRALISDIPVFKEIYAGFPVVFFRAGDRDDLQKKLMELLYQKEPAPLRLPENLASKYGFQKTAARVMETLSGAEGKGPS
jgi:glycosyltransferase involved in cell wall biosynthesis